MVEKWKVIMGRLWYVPDAGERVSDTASDETRELNRRLAVLATRPIPVVTR